jgi:hypothetical protein
LHGLILYTNYGSSGRYSVATSVVHSSPLAPKPCHRDHNVRASLMSPATDTRLSSPEKIHPDIDTLIIFTQCSSASPIRWRNTDGRCTPSSRLHQLNRGRHRSWAKGKEHAITKSTRQVPGQGLARRNNVSAWRVCTISSV